MPPSKLSCGEPWRGAAWIAHTQILLQSYRHWLGEELIARDGSPLEQARRLFEAPLAVVSHDTQSDPVLNYANRVALELWEMDLATLLRTPSRLTAEPMHRDERAHLLARTARDGYVTDYAGIRVTRSGRRFRIAQAVVWNLLDAAGNDAGQAACFRHWQFLDPCGDPA